MGAMRSASPTKASQHLFGRRHRVRRSGNRRRERGDKRSRSPQDRHAFELDLTIVSYRQIAIAIAQNHLTGIADRFNNTVDMTVTPRPDICQDSDIQVLDISTNDLPSPLLFNVYNEKQIGQNGNEVCDCAKLGGKLCLVNGNIRNRSLLPGADTYYGSGERQAFKKRDEKTGKLGSQDGKTNAAVRIIIGHWLDLQHDGYDGHWGALRPNKWNFHPTVSREYMRLFKLPVHHQVVFDLNAEGKSTAQFLDQSCQKPKETAHRFWQEYGAVSAPGLEFFLQSFGETQA